MAVIRMKDPAKLRAAGAEVETRSYPDMAHVGILLGLSSVAKGDRPVLDDVLEFLRRPPTAH